MSGIYVLKNPRWEDFEWTRKKENSINMWAWLGNGIVKAQRDGTTTSHYLRNVDVPPVPKKLSHKGQVNGHSMAHENGVQIPSRVNDHDEIKRPHNSVHIEQVSSAEDPVNEGKKVESLGTEVMTLADSVV